jgi:ferredoxin
VAKDVYGIDDDGYNIYRGQTVHVPEGLEDLARMGARACPDKVITIIED